MLYHWALLIFGSIWRHVSFQEGISDKNGFSVSRQLPGFLLGPKKGVTLPKTNNKRRSLSLWRGLLTIPKRPQQNGRRTTRERESRLIGRAAGLGYGSHWRTQTCFKRFWNPCTVGLKTSSTASGCPTTFNMKLYCREGKASISSRSTIDLWRHCVHTMRPNVHNGQSCQSYQTKCTPDSETNITNADRRSHLCLEGISILSGLPLRGEPLLNFPSCYGYRMMQFDVGFLWNTKYQWIISDIDWIFQHIWNTKFQVSLSIGFLNNEPTKNFRLTFRVIRKPAGSPSRFFVCTKWYQP